ncbi:DinB family protein [Mucilaginibacter sp. HMF5004]|uniref:DinB family protein n=1 Tax=Mucilaginibacter rivuli TaxID=2857527 RepID=UPI001C5D2733|nr:DinB family protein [Mucilaginibacter rivuli]MBW4888595.1 DinB family protein [Mucilaginibacter rivuli]
MSIAADKKNIENTLLVYRQKLDQIPDDQFNVTPPGGGWSYAEVYSHIMQATVASFIAVEKCSNGTGKTDTKRINWLAWLVLVAGVFPGTKFKAPASIAGMVADISKEDARNLIIKVKKRLDEVIPNISGSSAFCKLKHPRFGMLNAKQWLRFTGIHLTHHIKQLKRIEKKFQKR